MGISVEVMPDAGAPQVGVTVSGFGSSTLTVQRSIDGTSWETIRGADGVVADSALFVRDHTAPLNVPVTYRVISVGDTPAGDLEAVITVPSASAWIQDPLNPRSAVEINIETGEGHAFAFGSAMRAVYRQPVDKVIPLGSSLPVASIGQRMLAGEMPLRVEYLVASQGGELRRLLMSSGVLVVRGAPASLLAPVAYVEAGDAEEILTGTEGQLSAWDLTASHVAAPTLKIVVPWWTYTQVEAIWAGSDYDDVYAARPGDTYLDWLRDPEQP